MTGARPQLNLTHFYGANHADLLRMPTGKPGGIPQLHQMRGGGKPQNTDAAGAGNLLHPRDCLGYHSVRDCPPFDVAAQRILVGLAGLERRWFHQLLGRPRVCFLDAGYLFHPCNAAHVPRCLISPVWRGFNSDLCHDGGCGSWAVFLHLPVRKLRLIVQVGPSLQDHWSYLNDGHTTAI